MKRLLIILLVLGLSGVVQAQNWTTVTASKVTDGRSPSHLLANGQICFTATGDTGQAISYRIGGGGQGTATPYCAWIKNGAVQGELQIPNPNYTAPANIKYRIEISVGGNVIRRDVGVLITSDQFNYDDYVPSTSPLKTGQSFDELTAGTLRFKDGTSQTTAGGSGGTVADATATTKGKIALAGDLGGTADAPIVPALATKIDAITLSTALAQKEPVFAVLSKAKGGTGQDNSNLTFPASGVLATVDQIPRIEPATSYSIGYRSGSWSAIAGQARLLGFSLEWPVTFRYVEYYVGTPDSNSDHLYVVAILDADRTVKANSGMIVWTSSGQKQIDLGSMVTWPKGRYYLVLGATGTGATGALTVGANTTAANFCSNILGMNNFTGDLSTIAIPADSWTMMGMQPYLVLHQ